MDEVKEMAYVYVLEYLKTHFPALLLEGASTKEVKAAMSEALTSLQIDLAAKQRWAD